ncbi:MAG: hypothetical protein MUC51_08845 [Anaerolineae bacterium]|nr:hypothetical protein [Anaerolineae bacterium]
MKARFFSIIMLIGALLLTGVGGRSEAAPLRSAPLASSAPARPASFDCANVTQIPLAECNALVTLYSTTNGSNWSNTNGWLATDTPCTDWHGVTCSGGHVTELRLGGNALVGSIPHDVHHLSNLTVLDLSFNKLTGWIPSVLGDLISLTTLRLGYNTGLTWLIPWELGALTNLQELSLTGCNLFGPLPSSFAYLTNLTSLDVSFNYLSGGVSVVGGLPALEKLYLRNNQLRGPLPGGLKDRPITELFFESTALCEPADATFQTWLTGLEAGGNLGRTNVACGATAAAVSVTRNANDLVSSWAHEVPNTAYNVHRDLAPYFTPSAVTKQTTLPPAPTGVYTDTGALAAPGNYFYIVQSQYNDLSADSNETAQFTYELKRGN